MLRSGVSWQQPMCNRGRSCSVARGRTRSYIISRGDAQSFVSIGAKLSSGDILGGNWRVWCRRCSNAVGNLSQRCARRGGTKTCISEYVVTESVTEGYQGCYWYPV